MNNNNRFKFRVWEHHNNKFSDYPHGFCLDKNFTLSIPNDSFDGEIRKFTIQQWTGLIDKNGAEVYEGDIIKYSMSLMYQVVWDNLYASFKFPTITRQDGMYHITIGQVRNESVVIGNIFENKELFDIL